MSRFFNRLPGFTVTPPGVERQVLRRLPKILVLGSLILALPSLLAHLARFLIPEWETGTLLLSIDIYAISLIILHWTVVFTVAIAAFIVLVMKGPAYVADPYPMEERETLDTTERHRRS